MVLSNSIHGKHTCEICGVECKSAKGLKSHFTSLHQAK